MLPPLLQPRIYALDVATDKLNRHAAVLRQIKQAQLMQLNLNKARGGMLAKVER